MCSSETMKSLITNYLSQQVDQTSSNGNIHTPDRRAVTVDSGLSTMGTPLVLSHQDGSLPARSVLSASIDLSAAIDRRAGLLSAAPEPPRKQPAVDPATASVIYNEHFSGLQVNG
jgi:hypothetical protein